MKGSRYTILFCLLLQFSCCMEGFAHRGKIDSLQKMLPSLRDSARIDCVALLAEQYTSVNNFDSAAYWSQKVYTESTKIGYTHGVASFFYIRAHLVFQRDRNTHETEQLARESLKWFALTSNKNWIEMPYLEVGANLFFHGHTDEAYTYLKESCNWAEKNRNREILEFVNGFIYEHYRDIGDYQKAFEAFQRYLQMGLSFDGRIDTTQEYYMLGELHRRIENYGTALNYYRQLVQRIDLNHSNLWFRLSYPELFALNGKMDSAWYYYSLIDSARLDMHDNCFYLVSIGEFFLLKKQYGKALEYLLRGLSCIERFPEPDQLKRVLLDAANGYAGLQDYNHALAYTRRGLSLSLQTNAKQFIRDAYQILSGVYERSKPDSALFYYEKYIEQKEIVANDVLKGKFAAYSYDQKIVQLSKEKQIRQEQIKKAAWQKQFLIIGIVILCMLGIALFRNVLLKRKDEANHRTLAEKELQLHAMAREKTESEMKKQAAELEMQALRAQMNPHFIFNCLSSINRFILKNESEIASDYLTKFSRLVRMVLNNSQKEAILLEDELDMLRLYLDLERLRFKNSFDYSISFHNNIDASSVFIPPMLLQPFAENAIWHGLMHKQGNNGFIEIAFALESNILNCFITDNGIGRKNAETFKSKSAEKQKPLGMQITSKRLALLNKNMEQAFLDIEDLFDEQGNASGTRVTLKIQYKESNKAAEGKTILL